MSIASLIQHKRKNHEETYISTPHPESPIRL